MDRNKDRLAHWFRDSAPYINRHRGRTFVVYLAGDALTHPAIDSVMTDLALLHSLGIRVVVVHGIDEPLATTLEQRGIEAAQHAGEWITTQSVLGALVATAGVIRARIEARLSMGLVNSPMHGADLTVTSGNFVRARPLGIHEGVDLESTGTVRRVRAEAVDAQLDAGAVVVLSPIGYSPSGEIFRLDALDLASQVAVALAADKLVMMTRSPGITDESGAILSELRTDAIATTHCEPFESRLLDAARHAVSGGVDRAQLISYVEDGALIEEIFTRDGIGTQVIKESYETLRPAREDDVGGIIELISPLEDDGVLVRRPRELLENELDHFSVIERDGTIVSCGALYPFGTAGELACLATHPAYQGNARGESILSAIEQAARRQGLDTLFVLTTRTAHWFTERGFEAGDLDRLPAERQSLYNYQRNSRVFFKTLTKA